MQQAPTPKSLLRRTAVAILAAAASLMVLPASSASITFSGASAGENCGYSSMSVDPAGNVTVMCSAQASGGKIGSSTTPPPPTGPDTFTLSAPVTTVTTGGSFTAVITRSGVPSTSVVGLNIAVIGACSSTAASNGGGGTITVQPTDTGPFNIPVVAGASAGTCTLLFNVGYGNAVPGGSTQLNIAVGASTTPSSPPPSTGGGGIPTVAGCPTPAAGTIMANFAVTPGQHVYNTSDGTQTFALAPGQIAALPLPATVNGHASGQVQLTYNALTAASQTASEISISKCPGVIDPNGSLTGMNPAVCYFDSFTTADTVVEWYGKLVNGITSSSTSRCMALESNGPYYANIRYTYTPAGCQFGGGTGCGEQLQWNDRFP